MYKVILCGLGAVGLTFASKINSKQEIELRILADKNRINKFKKTPPSFNGAEQNFEYILPSEEYTPDLIIISTKYDGLNSAISYIKNFVSAKTRIISLINGISSEQEIQTVYPNVKVLKSYFIGHSAIRNDENVIQDGVWKIVAEKDEILEKIFIQSGINYFFPNDIDYSMWLKYTLNLLSNQTSAILNMTFGELKSSGKFIEFAKKIIGEAKLIGEKEGINNMENLETDSLNELAKMCNEGKTSMLQDILAKRPTEVDIFGGEIIKRGKKYGIPTPYNQVLYDLIKITEEKNEHSIHTC